MKTTRKLLSLLLAVMMIISACLVMVACDEEKEDPVDNATYTYRVAGPSIVTNWNPFTYTSNDGQDVLGYTTDGFYTFDYNEAKDGYKVVPSMATALPTDVTSEYVGKFGVEEGDKAKVWSIPLRDDLKFDNGDAITAEDFVESAKILLNPKANNLRADQLYSGNMIVHNAEMYLKQGSPLGEDPYEIYTEEVMGNDTYGGTAYADWTDEMYAKLNLEELVFELFDDTAPAPSGATGFWRDGNGFSLDSALGYGANKEEPIPTAEDVAALNGKTIAAIFADTELKAKLDLVMGNSGIGNGHYGANILDITYAPAGVAPKVDFDEVGITTDDEGNLIIALENELSGFYLYYSLTSAWLVHADTYRACESEVGGAYQVSYGTAVDKYVGYGPYKLTEYITDAKLGFTKNEHYWEADTNAAGDKLYQTTNISIVKVEDEATRLNMFLKGEIDSYGLQKDDMADYQSSEYTYFTEGDSVWLLALNPDGTKLATVEETTTPITTGNEVDKEILTIKEFRMALSFSLDRAAYSLALDPTGAVAKALFGNMIISDPNTGTAYRTTEEAKDTILAFWGLTDEVGEGKEYATKDEAIASITGYDPAGAKKMFEAAYEQAVEEGFISAAAIESGKWEVQIMIGKPSEADYYNNGYEFLKQTWTEGVEGTSLEGHIEFVQSGILGSSTFADKLRACEVDVLFGVGWTGSALNPYGLINAYIDPDYQYGPAWDTAAYSVDITVQDSEGEDVTLRASAREWGLALDEGKNEFSAIDVSTLDPSDPSVEGTKVTIDLSVVGADQEGAAGQIVATNRLRVLAALEGATLEQYMTIPVNADASASLKAMRVKFYTEEYVFGVGRGGIKYQTYTMNDAEWAAYIAEQGGTLNYK